MLKVSKYWIFQFSGWSIFAFFNIYIAFLTREINVSIIFLNILLSILGVLLTHFYRNFLLKQNWILLETEKLLKKVFVAAGLFGLTYTIIYYIFVFFFFKGVILQLKLEDLVGAFISILILFGIWNAIYFSWNYIENNRMILINRLKMESTLKDLELKTIRANLQPHFIFNSLNSIRALIDEDPELARTAITKISNILRNSITKQEATDTLENELKLVDDYLDLEKIRFEERLVFSKQIDKNTLQIQVPTMMLQTLVENAVKHGISMSEAGGYISISSFIENENVHIEIKNTGLLTETKNNKNSLGFGLSSSQQRLKILYNQEATLDLIEKNNEVILTITIPLKNNNL